MTAAQILGASGNRLFFHEFYERKDCENSNKNRSEVDFPIKNGNETSAAEVKTGRSANHSSMGYLMDAYSKQRRVNFHPPYGGSEEGGDLLYLPTYMAVCRMTQMVNSGSPDPLLKEFLVLAGLAARPVAGFAAPTQPRLPVR